MPNDIISDDIMDVANSVFIRALGRPMNQVIYAIAGAIQAERERCIQKIMAATQPGECCPASYFVNIIKGKS